MSEEQKNVVEAVAKAIHAYYEQWASDVSGTGNRLSWESIPEKMKDLPRDQARTAIAVLMEFGWRHSVDTDGADEHYDSDLRLAAGFYEDD